MIRLLALLLSAGLAWPAMAQTDEGRFRDCADCPEMVRIPAGDFVMGHDGGEEGRYEGPERAVSIAKPFALAAKEVTVGDWRRFVAATGHPPAAECRVYLADGFANSPDYSWDNPNYGRTPRDDDPVTCVTWLDAVAYAEWLAEETGQPYRLPTEAEWEYAAKAGTDSAFFWGEDRDAACAYANVYDASAHAVWGFRWDPVACDDGFSDVAPVGSFAPNPFGLYDMLGNVWEWVADCYVMPYPDGPTDGSAVEVEGACERRSVRGGSWITRIERHRAAFRGRDPEPTAFSFFGFRVARDL